MREDIRRELESLRQDVSVLNNKILKLSEIVESELDKEEIDLSKNYSDSIEKPVINRIPRPNQNTIERPIPKPIQNNFGIPNSNGFTPLNSNFTPLNETNNMTSFEEKNSKTKKVGTLEDSIGKNVMGIIASILIFIGLGTFMISVFSTMSDFIKSVLLLLFSFGLFGFGWMKLNKDKNAFSLSLTSCGIGAVYISFLISFFAFEIGNEIILFVELVAWSMAVFWMSNKISSFLFNIIGYIGVIIAVSLGMMSDLAETSIIYLLLVVTHIFLTCLFGRTDFNMKNNNVLKLVIYGLSIFTSCITVGKGMDFVSSDGDILTTFASLLFVVYNFYILYDLYRNNVNVVGVSLFLTPLAIFSMLGLDMVFSPYLDMSVWPVGIIILLFLVLFEVLGLRFDNQYKWVRGIFGNIGIVIFAFVMTSESEFIYNIAEYTYFTYIIIPIVLYYLILLKDNAMSISVFVLYFISIISLMTTGCDMGADVIIPILLHVVSLSFIVYTLKDRYNIIIKILSYFALILILGAISLIVCDNWLLAEEGWLLYYILTFAMVVIFEVTGLSTNWVESGSILKRNEYSKNDVLYYINRFFNSITLIVGLFLVNYPDFNPIIRLLLVLTTLIQCVLGVKRAMEIGKDLIGYYIGIKFTIYINVIIGAFIGWYDIGYIYSIVCLLISICSIIIGFNKRVKSFRLYGLILAILSVLKLVMIDMTAYNPDFLMFGFIISGLLCFGIVWIYNKMSKSIEEKDNVEISQNNWNNF